MRYLAILLLAPWLLILCWIYWAWPKGMPRTRNRRLFDVLVLLFSVVAMVQCALLGFDTATQPAAIEFGRASGGIWQLVLPALYAYGAFAVVLLPAACVRHFFWGVRTGGDA